MTASQSLYRQLVRRLHLTVKRLLDYTLAYIALLPMLALAVVLWFVHRRQGRVPVFCTEQRVDWNRLPFAAFKFNITQEDCRLRWIGPHLRRSGVNELPQIINVIIGQMGVVGPRPVAIHHDKACRKHLPSWDDRYQLRGGITGHAQLMFPPSMYPEGLLRYRKRTLWCDLDYVDNFTWWWDLWILVRTFGEAKRGHDA